MVMIQRVLHSPDLREYLTYSERVRTTNEKILRDSEVKVFTKNPRNMISKSLELRQAPEYSVILCNILAKTLILEALRNISCVVHTF